MRFLGFFFFEGDVWRKRGEIGIDFKIGSIEWRLGTNFYAEGTNAILEKSWGDVSLLTKRAADDVGGYDDDVDGEVSRVITGFGSACHLQ